MFAGMRYKNLKVLIRLINENKHFKLLLLIIIMSISMILILTYNIYMDSNYMGLVYIYQLLKLSISIALILLIKQLYMAIYRDELTGLWNRKYLHIILEYYMKRGRTNSYLSLAMIDIDDFKCVNDSYGHIYGDDVLATLSQVLKDNVRCSDMVFRWGGEEFIIVLPDTSEKDAGLVLERIRYIIETYDFKCKITVSCGIVSTTETINILKFIEKADKAMYEAKQEKNKVSIYKNALL